MFFFSSRRRHTRCALVTGVQTCALPISVLLSTLQDKDDPSTSSGRTVLIISVRHNRSSPLHKRRRSGSIAAMQFIDLSIPITNDVVSDPPVMRPNITYMTHENTWDQIAMFFPGLTKDDLPDGEGWRVAGKSG